VGQADCPVVAAASQEALVAQAASQVALRVGSPADFQVGLQDLPLKRFVLRT
jgi:hypothetical protein